MNALLLAAWLAVPSSAALAASPAGGAVTPSISHFDLGRQAFKRSDYEATLHEMMQVLIDNPKDSRAREYMRLAGERMIAEGQDSVSQERRALLSAYRSQMDEGRREAVAWMSWVLQSRASAADRRWAAAYDDAQRVVEQNDKHDDALEAQRFAFRGIARSLADGGKLSRKDALIYSGIFYYARGEQESAREALKKALTLGDAGGELDDERIRFYLAKVTPHAVLPPAPPKPEAPKPELPKPEPPKPAPVVKTPARPATPASRKAPPAPPVQPGQYAYAEGMKKLDAGAVEEAIELFERAAAEAPEREDVQRALLRARYTLADSMKSRRAEASQLYTLGLMLYGQGQRAEAVKKWRRAVELDPEHGYAARALAHAEEELRMEEPR